MCACLHCSLSAMCACLHCSLSANCACLHCSLSGSPHEVACIHNSALVQSLLRSGLSFDLYLLMSAVVFCSALMSGLMHTAVVNALLQVPAQQSVLAVISGPSGVGKDAVIKRLQAVRPDLHFVVTATSR